MTAILHVLPHRGGGAERYVDLLAALPDTEHARFALSDGRTPLSAARSLPRRYPALLGAARRADLLHVHGDMAAILTLPLLRAGRTPAVWTTHGLHLLRRQPRAGAAVRAAVGATRATLCTSQAERDELAALAPRLADRLLLARNGIPSAALSDDDAVATRAELGLAESDVAALFLGELEERKGPLDAVAAALAAREQGAPLVLLVAGDGPQRAEVEAAAGPAVRALGFRRDPDRLLAAADLFVLPSAREGLSFAVLEAMQAGLAMVVADGAGNPEAVGEAGVVVPAGDRDALTGVLKRLAEDPAERAALGAAARERCAREFTVERLLDGVRAGYARALAT